MNLSWLRRALHRPPTIADCLRAASQAPCEPLRAPDREFRGVVNGPRLVERTKRSQELQTARWRDDFGWFEIDWQEFGADYDLEEPA